MSLDIDMESYAGVRGDSAAASQSVDTNSYQEGLDEYPVNEALLDQPVKTQVDEQPSKQEINFKALRDEVDRIKAEKEAEKREYQLQLDMLRANMVQQAPKQADVQVTKRSFEGMQDSDIPNVAESRQELQQLRQEMEQRESMYQERLAELQVSQMHPDYAEVIEKYALPLVKQKPHLAEGIRGSQNKALFAYELGKMAQQMQERPVAQTPNENAQRIVENSRKPGTLSQAGGQGALSKADYYASMSDQEFMRMASRNLEGI